MLVPPVDVEPPLAASEAIMKPVRDTWCINLDITNKCPRKCANCHHLTQHCADKWEMDLATVLVAMDSLKGWERYIGVIGGEPIYHGEFEGVCWLFCREVDFEKSAIFFSTYGEHQQLIRNTFSYLNPNPHGPDEEVRHQPVLASCRDIAPDAGTMWKWIDACWVAEKWSPTITPNGCYRCEVMGSMDMALVWGLGLAIEPGWWQKDMDAFRAQVETFCPMCGMCVPNLAGRLDLDNVDDVTATARRAFGGSPRCQRGDVVDFDVDTYGQLKPGETWQPERYIQRTRDI